MSQSKPEIVESQNFRCCYSSILGHNIAKDFIIPALENAVKYKRITGDFSSRFLVAAAQGLSPFFLNGGKMFLITNGRFSNEDAEAIRKGTDPEIVLEQSIIREIDCMKDLVNKFEKQHLEALVWLLKTSRLEIKVGLLYKNGSILPASNTFGTEHNKIGIIETKTGDKIAFLGGNNESYRAYIGNSETLQAFYSWKQNDEERIQEIEKIFDIAWQEKSPELKVMNFPDACKQKFIQIFDTNEMPDLTKVEISESNESLIPFPTISERIRDIKEHKNKWKHQEEAVDWFLDEHILANGVGILMMATGTGKTITALKIIQRMFDLGKIDAVIINTNDRILHQWDREMSKWNEFSKWRRAVYWHNSEKKNSPEFFLSKKSGKCLMITDYFFAEQINKHIKDVTERILLIVDEVHHIGAEKSMEKMKLPKSINESQVDDSSKFALAKFTFGKETNQYKKFRYRLGLSATPFSEFDHERNQFIVDTFVKNPINIKSTNDWIEQLKKAKQVFYFGLEDGIKRGVLCPFEYIPLKYTPSPEDLEERKRVFRAWSALVSDGRISPEAPYIMAANVLKNSKEKIPIFKNFLEKSSMKDLLTRCIIFVQTTEYGRKVEEIIHEHTNVYHDFFSGDSEKLLIEFGKGNLEVLVTCHMISEGIDIKSVSNIVLFSSDREKLESIQRIGRALRTDPTDSQKVARIVDFIYDEKNKPESADHERMAWLTQLSKVQKEES